MVNPFYFALCSQLHRTTVLHMAAVDFKVCQSDEFPCRGRRVQRMHATQ